MFILLPNILFLFLFCKGSLGKLRYSWPLKTTLIYLNYSIRLASNPPLTSQKMLQGSILLHHLFCKPYIEDRIDLFNILTDISSQENTYRNKPTKSSILFLIKMLLTLADQKTNTNASFCIQQSPRYLLMHWFQINSVL